MEADLVKWIWANLPTLSVALILARLYFKVLQMWQQQESRCAAHSALIRRLKHVMMAEHPNRVREILEDKDEGEA